MAMRRGVAAAVAALLLAAAAGCGGDSAADDPPASSERSENEATTTTRLDPEKQGVGETIEIESLLAEDDAARGEAEGLRTKVLDAVDTHGWNDLAAATAAGFAPMFGEAAHWVNRANVVDGVSWDVDRPEFLVIHEGALLGLMFAAPDPGLDQPPPPGSPLVKWHYHRWPEPVCLEAGIITVALPDAAGVCPPGSAASGQSALMAHVWTVDNGDDPFATDMQAHQH